MSTPWTCPERVEERWYWVTDGEHVFPAIYRAVCAGGWGNDDTWEDFDRAIVAWSDPLPVPAPPTEPR